MSAIAVEGDNINNLCYADDSFLKAYQKHLQKIIDILVAGSGEKKYQFE